MSLLDRRQLKVFEYACKQTLSYIPMGLGHWQLEDQSIKQPNFVLLHRKADQYFFPVWRFYTDNNNYMQKLSKDVKWQ